MKKLLKIGAVSALVAIIMSVTAFAGTTFKDYYVVVGRFNGTGHSDTQKKATTGVAGRVRSFDVGGDYVVDVRMQNDSAHGDWVRDLNDGDKRNLPVVNALAAGATVQLRFSNDWSTPVNVVVRGDWRSN